MLRLSTPLRNGAALPLIVWSIRAGAPPKVPIVNVRDWMPYTEANGYVAGGFDAGIVPPAGWKLAAGASEDGSMHASASRTSRESVWSATRRFCCAVSRPCWSDHPRVTNTKPVPTDSTTIEVRTRAVITSIREKPADRG